MKKYLFALWAVVATLLSCTPPAPEIPEEPEEIIALVTESLSFAAVDAEPHAVEVGLHNCKEWNVTALDEWVKTEKTIVDDVFMLRVSVEDNTAEEPRITTVYVAGQTAEAELTVTQLGFAPAMVVEPKELSFEAEGGEAAVAITTNVEYTTKCSADWISVTQTETGLQIVAAENPTYEERKANVDISTDYSLGARIEVVQAAAEKPARVRENEACFVPYESITYESESRSGYGIELAYDNDLETYWSCPNSGIDENAVLTFHFNGKMRIDYMEYYPSPEYGWWGEFSVKYKEQDAKTYVELGDFDFGMRDGKQTLNFKESLMNVEEIVVEVKSAKGRSVTKGLLAGAAEIEFYYNDNVYMNALELFEDESCSVFRNKDFSEADLAKIQDEELRSIAEIMLARTPEDNEFRVAICKSYPNPTIDAQRFLNAEYSEYDNVTGMLLLPGNTYTICVSDDGRDDLAPKLTVINYKTPKTVNGNISTTEFNWAARDYALRPGINHIKIPANNEVDNYGGLCYVKLMSTKDLSIKVNFIDGEVNGYFDPTMHSTDRWEELLANSFAIEEKYGFPAHFDMRNQRIIMSFPSYLLRDRTKTGDRAKEVLDIYAEIIELEEELQGHKLFNTGGHANRMHMVGRYGGSFMYATSYHTGYNILAAPDCVNPDGLRAGCWGPAHEFGHVNQVRPILKWVGTTEVTNNICSAYVQWKFNDYTVLGNQSSSHGFNGAFRDLMARGCSHVLVGSWDAAYYLKVVPFWQLYLYFTEIKGMTDFYPIIYHTSRNYPDAQSVSNEEAMLRFCELVSDVVKLDMTEFFERWGFLTPVDGVWFNDYGSRQIYITQERIDKARKHMSQYPKPTQPIHFISEHNMHLFREPAEVTVGTVEKTPGSNRYWFKGWENCVAFIVEGSDGKWYAINDTSAAYLYTKWKDFHWGDSDGNLSPDGSNSKTYYCTVGSYDVNLTDKNTPALKEPRFYGVDANGVFHEFKQE
ncbi:MAG: M60 family metallopeptidase [Rikenellaceae bacterium]|nr:M60 family metallopeptidase [Rikenellaceae bacterium]